MSTKIKDIMSRDVEVAHPDDTLQEAARKMRSRATSAFCRCATASAWSEP